MIAPSDVNANDGIEAVEESVAAAKGHVASLDHLSASSGLIHANDAICNVMASATSLMPLRPPCEAPEVAPAPTVPSAETEGPTPDVIAAMALPAPYKRSTSELPPYAATNTGADALIPPHIEDEAYAAVVENDAVFPAALAHEPDPEPTKPASQDPAAKDADGIDEAAADAATVADAEIPSIAPTSTGPQEVMLEDTAPAPAHDGVPPIKTDRASVEESMTPPAEAPLRPVEAPALATKAARDLPSSGVVLPVQAPEANPAYAMAMKFAERGIPVFALFGIEGQNCTCGNSIESGVCKAGKHPRFSDSFRGATTKAVSISMWFKYNRMMNYGIATGRPVDRNDKILVIIDIDWYKAEAQQTVEALNLAGCFFHDTAEVLTGGGGRHLYYLAEAGAKFAQTAGPGIDIKGAGGYVIGPGSMHKSGTRYDWEASSDFFNGQEIADMPQWVYEKFGKEAAAAEPSQFTVTNDVTPDEWLEYKADLNLISPEHRVTWIQVLMALKNRNASEAMFEVAHDWSAAASTYTGAQDVRTTWNSIKAEGGTTIKTLKRLAQQAIAKEVDTSAIQNAPRAKPEIEKIEWRVPEWIGREAAGDAYPLDALPLMMRDAVVEVQSYAQTPVSLAACSALASLSIAAQGRYDVQRDDGLVGPCSLFILSIAESGERKSTLDTFFTRPLREYEHAAAVAAKPAIAEFNAMMLSWEAKNRGIADAISRAQRDAKATSTDEARLVAHHLVKPAAPLIPRVIYGDTTPEALLHGLAFGWPSGGIVSAEGGAVFGGHGMNKDTQMRNMAVMNELWDGKAIRVDRRTSESFAAKGKRLTIMVQVQPAAFNAFFGSSGPLARGSGYLARFLVANPASTQGNRPYKSAPKHWKFLDRFNVRLAEILAVTPSMDEAELKPEVLPLSAEAMEVWVDYYNLIECELGCDGDLRDVRDVASKSADNAARLAGLFHVLEGRHNAIDADHMLAATRLARWHLVESQRMFASVSIPKELANAAMLSDWIVARCKREGIALVPLQLLSQKGPYVLRAKEVRDAAIEVLVKRGYIKHSDGGPRAVMVNPLLLE